MAAEPGAQSGRAGAAAPVHTLRAHFRRLWPAGGSGKQAARRSGEAVRAAAAVAERRTVHSYRDQEPAQGRIGEAGSPTVLVSPQHSLFGYPADLGARFELGAELGRGGNAAVRRAVCRLTGEAYAVKSVAKALEGGQWSEQKRRGHLDAIRTEVEVLRRLRGSLAVATLEDVYEDATHVHIVMELCAGGELVHRIGSRHYSERTVASYMRAVLRTLAQCHSQRVLHRDVKPGNFLLLNESERAPLKAIDFGLAVPYEPEALPRTDLGLEGTPWYMAPEVLSSKVVPASDVWSAGVTAFQLLTGRFPFDDKQNPLRPSVTRIWQSILCEELNFGKPYWTDVSPEARDFVAQLLQKDPAQRPSAKQALQHAWLRGDAGERSTGKQLALGVVQRIQRFGQSSLLKRTVLERIAADLLTGGQPPERECPLGTRARPLLVGPADSPMQHLYERLGFGEADAVSRPQLLADLQALGYRLDRRETQALLDSVDSGRSGRVARAQLAASQLDWGALQEARPGAWLPAAQRAFARLDSDGDGVWSAADMLACLRERLPPCEAEAALAQAMREARKREASVHKGLDLPAFLTMLRADSRDSLDQYDDRMGSSADRLSLLADKSCRSGDAYASTHSLETVNEVC